MIKQLNQSRRIVNENCPIVMCIERIINKQLKNVESFSSIIYRAGQKFLLFHLFPFDEASKFQEKTNFIHFKLYSTSNDDSLFILKIGSAKLKGGQNLLS